MAAQRTRSNSEPPPPAFGVPRPSGGSPLPKVTQPLPPGEPKLPRTKDRRDSESLQGLIDRIRHGAKERRSFRDRRATPRVAVGLPMELRVAGEKQPHVRTHDLSTFGLSVRTGPSLPRGTVLSLTLFLPDRPEAPVQLDGVVVAAFQASVGVRVKFVDPPLDAVRRIHRLLA